MKQQQIEPPPPQFTSQTTKLLLNQPKQYYNINMPFFKKSKKIFYVPVYLRIVVKSIKSLNFQSLEGSLNLTIVLNTNTWGLPEILRTYIDENISLSFNRNQTLKLGKGDDHIVEASVIEKMKNLLEGVEKSKNKQYNTEKKISNNLYQSSNKEGKGKKVKIGSKYTIRMTRNATVQPYVFFTPFQIIDLVVSVEVPDLKYQHPQTGEFYTIKFNIMKREQLKNQNLEGKMPIISKMLSSSCTTDFGIYSIATKRMDVQYTSQRAHKTLMTLGKNFYNIHYLDHKRETVKERKTINEEKSINYGHFHIPVSKNPITVLTTLFIPLWLFSFINIAIFTLPPSLGNRVGAIATIMLAFVSLIPSIRQQIPTSPTFTVFEGLVYLQTVTSILCLLQSLVVQNDDEGAQHDFMKNYKSSQDIMFCASYLITFIIIFIPISMYLWYKIYLRQSHYLDKAESLTNDKSFEDWVSCKEGNERFLNKQNFDDLIFASQGIDCFNQIRKFTRHQTLNSPTSTMILDHPRKVVSTQSLPTYIQQKSYLEIPSFISIIDQTEVRMEKRKEKVYGTEIQNKNQEKIEWKKVEKKEQKKVQQKEEKNESNKEIEAKSKEEGSQKTIRRIYTRIIEPLPTLAKNQ